MFNDPTISIAPGRLIELSTKLGREVRLASRQAIKHNEIERAALIQFYKSGTSVGANIREARYAASLKDHINKLKIAEKELSEFFYWLDILCYKEPLFSEEIRNILYDTAKQCFFILASSIKTCKAKLVNI